MKRWVDAALAARAPEHQVATQLPRPGNELVGTQCVSQDMMLNLSHGHLRAGGFLNSFTVQT